MYLPHVPLVFLITMNNNGLWNSDILDLIPTNQKKIFRLVISYIAVCQVKNIPVILRRVKSGMGIRNYYSPTGTFLGPEDPGGGYSQYSDDRDDLRIFYGL